mmetsp:Transcript_25830/g.58231  ORF Transcript_25830/g.58231 Transcript_25830/m.58231 type:complete len:108 (-) Transcript_25830:287-610(-)
MTSTPFGEDGEEGRRRGRRYSTVAAPTTRHIHQMVSRTKTTVADGQGHSFREDDEDMSGGGAAGKTHFLLDSHSFLEDDENTDSTLPTVMTDSVRVLGSQHVFSRNP